MQFEKLVAAHQAYRKQTTAQALAAPGRATAAPAAAPRRRGKPTR
jgi:hypothetical protein